LIVNGDMSVWQQQRLDDLRRAVAALLERRALAADIDGLRRLDAEIEEHARAITAIERKLKAIP
jgi:hypothetical protein